MTETQTNDQVDENDETVEPSIDARAEARATEREAVDAVSDGALVEARTADTHATEKAERVADDKHIKVFVIPGDSEKPTASNYDHEPNIAATRQYMMSQGLRPTGDVEFKGSEKFGPGGKSWALTYAVTAVPAERFDFTEVGVLDQQDDDADEVPTMDNTRPEIDAYAKSKGIDTSAAKDKAEALALLTKPTE